MGRSGKTSRGLATQARIVEAATELFLRDGYVATTVTAIAKAAGVSAQAVYLAFGSKVAILETAVEVAAAGDAEEVAMVARPWMDQLRDCPDAPGALDIAVVHVAAAIERSSPLYGVIQAAAADPEVAALEAKIIADRLQSARDVMSPLAEKTGFNEDLTAERAAAIGYALFSPEVHRMLVDDCGWSPQQWRDYLGATLRAQMLDPTPVTEGAT